MWTHDKMLRLARRIEAKGDKEKATLIRKLAKDRFRAVMTYGMNRSFARLQTDKEIVALPPRKLFPWLEVARRRLHVWQWRSERRRPNSECAASKCPRTSPRLQNISPNGAPIFKQKRFKFNLISADGPAHFAAQDPLSCHACAAYSQSSYADLQFQR